MLNYGLLYLLPLTNPGTHEVRSETIEFQSSQLASVSKKTSNSHQNKQSSLIQLKEC